MLTLKKTILTVAAAIITIASVGGVNAQYLDLSDMVNANLAFDQQFHQWAWDMSWELAWQIPNDQPLPFNAMTISRSVSEASAAWDSYNQAWYHNSNHQSAAVSNWSTAHRGNWYYENPYSGQTWELPYSNNTYYQDQGGYLYYDNSNAGYYDPYMTQLQPVYNDGWW